MIAINCQVCGTELAAGTYACHRCGALAKRPPGPAGQQNPGHAGLATQQLHPLMKPATWLTGMLVSFAIATLAGFAAPAFDLVGILLVLAFIPVFLVWLYHASRNAGQSGYPQRRSAGWAIGGWFVPVISLWFPYQVVADIWRAAQPPERRTRTPWLVVAWWTCWLLARVTSVQYTHTGRSFHISMNLYTTTLSRLFLTVAAILLIPVIRTVSRGSLGRLLDPSAAAGTSAYPVAGAAAAWAPLPLPDPDQQMPGPASNWEGPAPSSPPMPAGYRAAPAALTVGTSVPGRRSWPHGLSRRAKTLIGLSIGIGVIALTAVVAVNLAAPARTAGPAAPATGISASAPPPATPTTAPVRLSKDQRWLGGLDSLQTRMNDAMGSGTLTVTPSSLRAQAKQLRRCTPGLARLGPPTAQLRPVYQQARRGCAGYDQAVRCYTAAASAFAESGPGLVKFTRLLGCGDAGANKGSRLLADAAASGFEFQTP
jgi:hypothetical protein